MTKKSCKKGYYYCFTSKKCKKIPVGYHVMTSGRLMKDSEHKEEEETKKNGNGTNGNGNGNGDSSGISDGGGVSEGWSAKYKRSIDCDNPKGFSQRAHCQGRKKVNEAKEKGDHEYSMARSQLATVMSAAKRLRAKMKGEGEIEAWVQSKITKAADYLDSAADYVDSGEMNEGKNGRCPEGQYYCYTNKECRPIPKGFMVDPEGMLRKENGASIDESKSGDSSLRDWFTKSRASDGTPGWVQLGGKYAGKPCAKQPGQKTKPKCGSSKMASELNDKEEETAFRRKNLQDKNPNRRGKAKNVATEKKKKLNASYSNWRSELEDLNEFLGGKPGDGYIGHPNLDIKNPFAKKQTKKEVLPGSKGGGLIQRNAAGLGDARMRQDAEIRRLLGQSFEPEGEMVFEGDTPRGQKPSVGMNITPDMTQPKPKPPTTRQRVRSAGSKYGPKAFETEMPVFSTEEKDACYKKVKSRYKIWPSAYASGALVKCREVGAANWGNKTKKEEYEISNWKDDFKATEYESVDIIKTEPLQPSRGIGSDMLGEKCWDGYVQKGMKKKGKKVVPNCVKEEEKKVKRWWDDDGDGIGWEEGEVKKSKKKKKTRKEGFSNWREELSEEGVDTLKDKRQGSEPKKPGEEYKNPYGLKGIGPGIKSTIKVQKAHFEPEGELIEDWQKVNKGDKTDGMSQKAVNAYRRENPGSKLKTAVTEKNPGGKRAKRRKSFCARSDGQRKMHNIDCSKTPDKAICKARRRWRC